MWHCGAHCNRQTQWLPSHNSSYIAKMQCTPHTSKWLWHWFRIALQFALPSYVTNDNELEFFFLSVYHGNLVSVRKIAEYFFVQCRQKLFHQWVTFSKWERRIISVFFFLGKNNWFMNGIKIFISFHLNFYDRVFAVAKRRVSASKFSSMFAFWFWLTIVVLQGIIMFISTNSIVFIVLQAVWARFARRTSTFCCKNCFFRNELKFLFRKIFFSWIFPIKSSLIEWIIFRYSNLHEIKWGETISLFRNKLISFIDYLIFFRNCVQNAFLLKIQNSGCRCFFCYQHTAICFLSIEIGIISLKTVTRMRCFET